MKRKLAEKFGAPAEELARLQLALWMVAHGAAMLLIAKTVLPEEAKEARTVFTNAVATLLRDAAKG